MRNVVMKALIIILTSILIVSVLNINVFGDESGAFDTSAYNAKTDTGDAEQMTRSAIKTVLTVTRIITTGIAIIMLCILAMKYMMAAPGERAEIKKHAVVYVVGAVVMFAAAGILTLIESFSSNLSAT